MIFFIYLHICAKLLWKIPLTTFVRQTFKSKFVYFIRCTCLTKENCPSKYIHLFQISDDEKSSILSDLMAAGGRNSATMDTQEFFKVCHVCVHRNRGRKSGEDWLISSTCNFSIVYCKILIFRVTLFSRGNHPEYIPETLLSRIVLFCSIILTW